RFIGHVARQGGVVAEDGVFHHGLSSPNGLQKIPHVGAQVVPRIAFVRVTFRDWLLSRRGIVVFMPLLVIRSAHFAGEALRVIAGRSVFAALREIGDRVFGDLQNSL